MPAFRRATNNNDSWQLSLGEIKVFRSGLLEQLLMGDSARRLWGFQGAAFQCVSAGGRKKRCILHPLCLFVF